MDVKCPIPIPLMAGPPYTNLTYARFELQYEHYKKRGL